MIKKLLALLLSTCLMLCLSACELDNSQFDGTSSDTNTSVETEDVFYEDETQSKVSSYTQSIEQSTTSKEPDDLSETSTSSLKPSKSETSSKDSVSKAISSKKPVESKVTVPDEPETEGNLVWVPTNGGKKYHARSGCSNMKEPIQVTKETAESNGYGPCKRCY